MKRYYHIYNCVLCSLTFAVDQAYEDQTAITCPDCNLEAGLVDVGYGEMVEIHDQKEEE